ncbi:MAG TPA: XrtA system polysaccharide chain length determinant [Candidatus Acidoferrales bacterium]|nr:XrtA system polysaccharide chain length determinant [Candidatus Acidoferrales bacterium]
MNPLPELDVGKILEGFYRRKWFILAFALVVFTLAAYLAHSLPNVYRSSTLILISPQRIPSSYIAPTVTSSIRDRIHAINQQIMSRTRLERIVNEFNLYPPTAPGVTMEDRVALLRKNIRIEVRRNDAFQVAFDSESPELAMRVATRLAGLFIEENLKVREQQAVGTTSFLTAEANRLLKELEEQEAAVNRYKAQYRFELPDQLDANLRTIERLQNELQNNLTRVASLQERKADLEKQVIEAETIAPEIVRGADGEREAGGGSKAQQIRVRKTQLEALLVRYSEKHPDVVRLKQEIAALEGESGKEQGAAAEGGKDEKKGQVTVLGSLGSPIRDALLKHIGDVNSQIQSLQSRNEALRRDIAVYQARIDNTPLRGIELAKISRSHDITLAKYQDLLRKGLDSQLSENMERREKGEQFQIIDPANLPQRPIRPNRQLILTIGLLAGLLGGLGLVFLWESLDNSLKGSDELGRFVNLPLLATIPGIATRAAVLEQRRTYGFLILSSLTALAVGVVCIRLFGARFF